VHDSRRKYNNVWIQRYLIMVEKAKQIMFKPGDIVRIKHSELQYSPANMLITEKVLNKDNSLQGMRCVWFDKDEVPHEMILSTKDLLLVKSGE